MNIRGIEIDFDFLDADNVEILEKEIQKVLEKNQESKLVKKNLSDAIKTECNIIDDFIDNVFGQGISEKIFQGKKNLTEHIKVFEEIIENKIKQQNELQNTFNRYMPNRQQRRNNKYKGRK